MPAEREPTSTSGSVRPAERSGGEIPRFRPVERLWPYAELSESHSLEELAELDPDVRAALFGELPRPFSITVVFPDIQGSERARVMELAADADDFRTVGTGARRRHRARFGSGSAARLRELYRCVGHLDESEVLIDERPVPYARELWLPLVWLLLMGRPGEPTDADDPEGNRVELGDAEA